MKAAALLLLGLALASPAAAAKAPKADDAKSVVGLGLVVKIVGRYPVIDALVPGGPAAKDGRLKPGDRIEGVAQGEGAWEDTAGLKLAQIVAKIRGPRGSSVSVRAVRSGEDGGRVEIVVRLKREVLKAQDKP
jgi:carboxyl-terminal processing protease